MGMECAGLRSTDTDAEAMINDCINSFSRYLMRRETRRRHLGPKTGIDNSTYEDYIIQMPNIIPNKNNSSTLNSRRRP